jgi:hypothetical protein
MSSPHPLAISSLHTAALGQALRLQKVNPGSADVPLICVNDRIAELGSISLDMVRVLSGAEVWPSRLADLGDKKPFFRMAGAVPGTAHVEVIIDDKSIDREHASLVLRMMAERLLECNWPPDQACGSPSLLQSGR